MADRGIWIRDTAREMSPDALGELLALAQMTTAAGMPSPQFRNSRKKPPMDWLVARNLTTWRSTGWRKWEVGVSKMGWLVLLARVEADLIAVGRLPAEEECADGLLGGEG